MISLIAHAQKRGRLWLDHGLVAVAQTLAWSNVLAQALLELAHLRKAALRLAIPQENIVTHPHAENARLGRPERDLETSCRWGAGVILNSL